MRVAIGAVWGGGMSFNFPEVLLSSAQAFPCWLILLDKYILTIHN